jgi:hypothetical protein
MPTGRYRLARDCHALPLMLIPLKRVLGPVARPALDEVVIWPVCYSFGT